MKSSYRHLHLILAISLSCSACSDCGAPEPSDDIDAGIDAGVEKDSSTTPDGFFQPFPASELGWGLHVIATAPDEIYVAGGTPARGRLMHFDGAAWTAEPIGDVPLLNWVADWDDETTVVGNGGTVLQRTDDAWAVVPVPTDEDLWGVWGASADDVWAVGGRGRAEGQATILRRLDGEWQIVPVPPLARENVNAFFKVWGTAEDDVYIVGQRGAVLHFDGAELREITLDTDRDLISLWGTGPDDVIIVGGRSNGVVAHYDGTTWRTEDVAPAPGLNGVWMPKRGEFWIGGARGLLRRGSITPDGFDIPREAPVSRYDIHAVYGVEGYGLIAVGGNFEAADGPHHGVVLAKEEGWQ